jgi:murein L,D-transpeptidase YcbB/YkuD
MAGYLLRADTSWTPTKIDTAMHQQKEKWVTLKKTIPVFMAYFTSWVDTNGTLQFRKDIYDLDEKMFALLFKKEDE